MPEGLIWNDGNGGALIEWAYHETFFNFFGQEGVNCVGSCKSRLEIGANVGSVGESVQTGMETVCEAVYEKVNNLSVRVILESGAKVVYLDGCSEVSH